MSYFDENNLERVQWHCSLNLDKYFANPTRGKYNKTDEYVVTWYENYFSFEKSNALVEVTFNNLTHPTFSNVDGKKYQSFLVIKLPINYLHKIPFGSIWENGKSKQMVKLEEFKVTFSEDKQLTYKALSEDKESHPFEADKYINASYLETFKKDKNKLLIIKYKNNDKSYIVHPLHFFMAHYGYSSELKRILITNTWNKVKNKLLLAKEFKEKGVFIPNNLTRKDAVFLYHLKYDTYTQNVVKELTDTIIFNKKNSKTDYLIRCWHDKPITLSFNGIKLGNCILCCQITGISQPPGETINLYYHSVIKTNKNSKGQGDGEPQYKTYKYTREHELEKLNIALDNVNNLVTADIIERLKLLGKQREVNPIRLPQKSEKSGNSKLLNYGRPENYGVGEKEGKTGSTGIANCFYDVSNDQKIEGKSRLDIVWEHAKKLHKEQNASVEWYTPQCGFKSCDNFRLISLEQALDSLRSYPVIALILRVRVQKRTFFVLSFPAKNNEENSGFSSVVYEPQNIQQFLSSKVDIDSQNENLFKLLVEIISRGGVNSDYVDSKDGKMSSFRHVTANKTKNNWVWNGIKKLL
ncbi:hypothetical protein [Gilliamella apicola]|uniref:hypothetical protein n=1 Tax=Gilliamella apicola TaxID=1196095 RepID=UPI002FEE19F1